MLEVHNITSGQAEVDRKDLLAGIYFVELVGVRTYRVKLVAR